MKRSVALILVCSILIPFTARSQNEGIKAVANPQPFEESTMYSQIAQDLAMIQEQVTTGGGGATSPSGFLPRQRECTWSLDGLREALC